MKNKMKDLLEQYESQIENNQNEEFEDAHCCGVSKGDCCNICAVASCAACCDSLC